MSDLYSVSPAFGRYAVPGAYLVVRRWIAGLPPGRASRWLASGLRRALLARGGHVFDVEAFPGVRVRLHPRSNRCEKAVLTGAQFFDAEERALLASEIRRGPASNVFVLADVGANVGFYSLFACAVARQCGRPIRAIAIEPDKENARRLSTNLALNGFDEVALLPVAVGETAGRGAMAGGENNRGERRLVEGSGGDVQILSLAEALARASVLRVDAMKMDIEGHDLAALRGFFAAAPESLWPTILIVEISANGEAAMTELCTAAGYRLEKRTRLNAIFRRTPVSP